MRVLQVNTSDRGGGAETISWYLHQRYLARGHDAWLAVKEKHRNDARTVYAPNGCGIWWRLRREYWSKAARHRIRGLTRLLSWMIPLDLPGRRYREAWLKGDEDYCIPDTAGLLQSTRCEPDIIHAHNLHGGYFNLDALPVLSARANVVLTLHDAWLLSGHCAHSLDCDRWLIGCGECPDLTIHPSIASDTTATNWARRKKIYEQCGFYLATPSRWLMDKVEKSILWPA